MSDKGHQLLVTRCVENLRENNDVDRKKLLDRDLVRSPLEVAEVAIRTPQKGSHNSALLLSRYEQHSSVVLKRFC